MLVTLRQVSLNPIKSQVSTFMWSHYRDFVTISRDLHIQSIVPFYSRCKGLDQIRLERSVQRRVLPVAWIDRA